MEEENSGFPQREGAPSLPLFELGSYSNFLEIRKCRPNPTAVAQNTTGNLKKERAGLKGKSTDVHWYVHVHMKIFPVKNLIIRTQAQAQVYTRDPRNASGEW